MKSLFERLAKFLRQPPNITLCETSLLFTYGISASQWDEILMACAYNEHACMYLDYLGPRR